MVNYNFFKFLCNLKYVQDASRIVASRNLSFKASANSDAIENLSRVRI